MAFFEPTSSERRGLLILCAALLLALLAGVLVFLRHPKAVPVAEQRKAETRSNRYYAVAERQFETFDFDPNVADSTTLLRLGFAPFMVRGIYKYRAKGGRYHEPADVKRIPGMTNELWLRLASHIQIDKKYQYVTPEPRSYSHQQPVAYEEPQQQPRDTMLYPVKLQEGSVVALNEADTTALKKIPGIGSYYARRIVYYRQQLGGYASVSQLQEIEGMPEDVGKWLTVDPSAIHRIDVNHATKNQLVRHPYLRVYRAQDIWNRRHNQGPLKSIDDLRSLPSFSEADIERLTPYLSFD